MITKFTNAISKISKSIKDFHLTLKLKDQIYALSSDRHQLQIELDILKKQTENLKRKYQNLSQLETNLQKVKKNHLDQQLSTEIKRLGKLIDSQTEIIENKPIFTSQLVNLTEPDIIKSSNPISLMKNFFKFKSDLNNYEKTILGINQKAPEFTQTDFHPFTNSSNLNETKYKPDYIKETDTHLEIGGKLKRYYYLADIPAFLSPYIYFRLLNSSLPFTISSFIEPTSSSELLKKAKQRLSVLEMQQNERLKSSKTRDQKLDKNIDEVTSFIDEIIHEVEKGVVFSLYLELEADTVDELKSRHKQLESITSSLELTFNQYTFGHKKAFKNFLPFGEDHLKENKIMQSSAISYLLPFVSKQLQDPEGIFMGINSYNDSLVLLNLFTSRNNNVNIFGVSGSGKSVTAKVLMSRLFMRGIKIIVIDPEGEYLNIAKTLGGEVISFSRDNGINPFYVNSAKENEVLDHISTLKTFFKFFIPTHNFDGSLLDEKLIELYEKHTPNFENLLSLLGEHPMAKDLSVLSSGSLRGIFNSNRKLKLENDFIVLDLHDLKKDEKRDPAMYLLTSLIWNLINRNNHHKRMLFIDEAHKLLVDHDVAIFYRELVKQARKRNLGIVSITQDVDDFLKSEYGKAIITNSETKMLLKQSYAALSEIGSIYPMTDEEKQQLGQLNIGELILFRESEHILLNIAILPFENEMILGQNSS